VRHVCDVFLRLICAFNLSLVIIIIIIDNVIVCYVCRLNNVFIIGKGNKPWVSLPRGKGVRLSIAEERDRRIQAKAQ